MRVVGGSLSGRRFDPPMKKWPTRPTTDYAKEALYNILQHRIDFAGVIMLDLFGGSGAHTYEAVSRGCQQVTYVEKYVPCIKYVKQMLREFGIEDNVDIVKSDVFTYIKNSNYQFDFIFADPPYALLKLPLLPDLILDQGLLTADGILVIEHDANHDFKEHNAFHELRTYGGCHFSFFHRSI